LYDYGWRWSSGRGAGAIGVGPAKITLKTENDLAGLPIAASKHASNNPVRRSAVLDDLAVLFDVRATPEITDMSANIKSGPIVWDRDRSNWYDWCLYRHVSSRSALRDRTKNDA
jgi:hypothetical protein